MRGLHTLFFLKDLKSSLSEEYTAHSHHRTSSCSTSLAALTSRAFLSTTPGTFSSSLHFTLHTWVKLMSLALYLLDSPLHHACTYSTLLPSSTATIVESPFFVFYIFPQSKLAFSWATLHKKDFWFLRLFWSFISLLGVRTSYILVQTTSASM